VPDEVLDILTAAVTSAAVQVRSVNQRSDAAIRSIFESRLRSLDPTIGLRLEESGASGPQGSHRVGPTHWTERSTSPLLAVSPIRFKPTM
jgi:hypothetical protein